MEATAVGDMQIKIVHTDHMFIHSSNAGLLL